MTVTRCDHCGSANVVSIRLKLGDGTPVIFSTCQFCEFKSWAAPQGRVPLARVLELTASNVPR